MEYLTKYFLSVLLFFPPHFNQTLAFKTVIAKQFDKYGEVIPARNYEEYSDSPAKIKIKNEFSGPFGILLCSEM